MAFGNGLEQHKSQHSHAMRLAALVGVGALGLFLLLRGRGTVGTSGISSTQEQQDIANAVAQQQASDQSLGTPSTFADNGAQAAGLADAVTQGLGGVQDALTNFTAAQQSAAAAGSTPATAAPPDAGVAAVGALGGGLAAAITALGNGQHTATQAAPAAAQSASAKNAPLLAPGASSPSYALTPPKNAPGSARWSGSSSPGAGWRGIGGGWWVPPTVQTPARKPTPVANHGGGQKQAGGQKQNTHTRK